MRHHPLGVRWTLSLAVALFVLPACDPGTARGEIASEVAPDASTLRAEGRPALKRLIDEGAPDELIDAVAQQRDAAASGLYWETDLDTALARSRERGVPVLSLRMLGALTDEYSCANSRFFRTLLYTDPALASVLDERFVLHWSSERPVPQVEIDFGDGRVLRTTTTGNSAHYVMDDEGRVLDVLPGLYDARTFEARLEDALRLHDAILESPERRETLLREHHRDAARAVEQRLASIMSPDLRTWMGRTPGRDASEPVPALAAQPITASKAIVETPLLQLIDLEARSTARKPVEERLRGLAQPVTFSEDAERLIRRDRPQRDEESAAAYEDRIDGLLRAAGENVAFDTLINEARLHYQLHSWFAAGDAERDFERLNARVYRELFATPANDPWLGLVDDAVYDGLSEVSTGARG